jgi:hypothetical protein
LGRKLRTGDNHGGSLKPQKLARSLFQVLSGPGAAFSGLEEGSCAILRPTNGPLRRTNGIFRRPRAVNRSCCVIEPSLGASRPWFREVRPWRCPAHPFFRKARPSCCASHPWYREARPCRGASRPFCRGVRPSRCVAHRERCGHGMKRPASGRALGVSGSSPAAPSGGLERFASLNGSARGPPLGPRGDGAWHGVRLSRGFCWKKPWCVNRGAGATTSGLPSLKGM